MTTFVEGANVAGVAVGVLSPSSSQSSSLPSSEVVGVAALCVEVAVVGLASAGLSPTSSQLSSSSSSLPPLLPPLVTTLLPGWH